MLRTHTCGELNTRHVGQQVTLPLTGRTIPVIADAMVDREFGTGVVKVTPAHDLNDYAVGQRHGLEMIGVLTLDARINDNAPAAYRGLDRFAARDRHAARRRRARPQGAGSGSRVGALPDRSARHTGASGPWVT